MRRGEGHLWLRHFPIEPDTQSIQGRQYSKLPFDREQRWQAARPAAQDTPESVVTTPAWPELSATHILMSCFGGGHVFTQKVFKRALWLPQAKECQVLSTTHILGSHLLKGPNSREKTSKRKPGQPREAKPRKAERGTERPRKLQRGRAWIERAGKKSPKAPGRLEKCRGSEGRC